MKMDALQCEYPHSGMDIVGHGPITPPATPTQEMSRTPTFSSCSESQFNQHEYSQPEYVGTQYSSVDYTSSPSLSPPESPMTTPKSTPTHTPAHTPLSSTPTKSSMPSSRSRKNSFVYDVRLTDEQFLFFVPDFDLVKSHLMFAVREEVEVLKEKITELMERISQLEYENTVLRQYATQEALQQIQQPRHSSNT
ncbi:TSC22 domain family protein 1-like isoform X1 [Homarus americanus]|uniref:TSC22 domain family protein 4-like n=1 Tax=Homarus americanus TaxID=6706 RepID=A0A8J5MYY9_HOMAM|nr:TSC22 domain family protein 1-like isoform X1 [Homarus americanus]KAG7169505.1 TSC22 domain family protein 4-like [Homarus americanus]